MATSSGGSEYPTMIHSWAWRSASNALRQIFKRIESSTARTTREPRSLGASGSRDDTRWPASPEVFQPGDHAAFAARRSYPAGRHLGNGSDKIDTHAIAEITAQPGNRATCTLKRCIVRPKINHARFVIANTRSGGTCPKKDRRLAHRLASLTNKHSHFLSFS